jgi:hypothetical protein
MLDGIYNYLCCNMVTIILAMIFIGLLYYAWSFAKKVMNKFKKSNNDIKDILKNKIGIKDQPNLKSEQEKAQTHDKVSFQEQNINDHSPADDSSELTLSSLDEKSSIYAPKSAIDELAMERIDDIDNITFEDLTEDGEKVISDFVEEHNESEKSVNFNDVSDKPIKNKIKIKTK